MASIVPAGKRWRAFVCVGRVRDTKTFGTRREAAQWAADREREIAAGGAEVTFGEVAERWLTLKLSQLGNPENRRTVEQSIRDYVLPMLAARPIAAIKRTELVSVVKAILDPDAPRTRAETAHRVGRRIREIFENASDHGEITEEQALIAARLSRVLPPVTKRHHAAVQPEELPKLLKAIDGYPVRRETGGATTRLALLLMAHTFLRTSELIGARWDELVVGDPVWVVPGVRMKRKRGDREGLPHVVPLSPEAQAILAQLREVNGDSPYIIASPYDRDAPVSKNTLLFALYRIGYKGLMTGHGFRALASSILNQSKLWSRDAIERQLAHSETDEVRAAYHRAEYLAERRDIMKWWGAHLAALMATTSS